MRHNEAAQPHADAGATPAQLWDAIALGGEASVVAREVLVGVQERGSTVVRSVSSGFLDGEDWCEEYDYALTETLSRHAAGGRRPYRFRADVGDSSRPHADCIGLVVLAPGRVVREDPHFARLIAAALNEASTRGLTLSVHAVSPAELSSAPPLAGDPRYAGALLVNVTAARLAGTCARRQRAGLISLGRSAPWLPCVTPDNGGGAVAAVSHLVAQGRRRIAMVAGPAWNSCASERASGYREAMLASGLCAATASADFTPRGAVQATTRLLHQRPALDALFVASDLMAAGALAALRALGRRVPEDVAVVGFDNSLPSVLSAPALSTVHQPVEEIVAAAVKALVEERGQYPDEQRLPTELVVRASSAT